MARKIGRIDVAALGVGDDVYTERVGRGIRGHALKAVEPDQIGGGRVGQGFRRGQTDAEAGKRAGPDPDGDHVQVADVQSSRLNQVAHAGDQIAAVFTGRLTRGPMDRSRRDRKFPPRPAPSRCR